MNKNTYYVPVEIKDTIILAIEAVSQRDAVKHVEECIQQNEFKVKHDSVNILENYIECKQDDEILDNIIKDFGLETEKRSGSIVTTEKGVYREIFEHEINVNA